jgi:hypothetical protein
MSSLADKIFQAKSSAVENAPKVWVIKPEMDAVAENEMLGHPYPEFNRKALLAKWFPNNFEVKQWYVKEGDIMEYFVVFFDAEEGGLYNEMAVQIAKACGVAPTGNFVVMRKKWFGEEERTIDMGVSVFEFLSFIQPKKVKLPAGIKLSGASAPPQKIDGFSKESLEGKNNNKSLNNMSSISEVKKSNIYASVCNPPCVPRSMMGTSWWKCLGYPSACGCAEVARLENRPPMPNANPSNPLLNEVMRISIIKSRNVIGVFPDKYVNDDAPKAVREKYLEYWMEFCKEQGVDAKGGTMEVYESPANLSSAYPQGLKNVVFAPLLSEVQEMEKGDISRKFSVSCGHMMYDSEVKSSNEATFANLGSEDLRDMVIGMAKMDIEDKWIEFSKHRLRCVKMSFADSDSPAVPAEKQCVFCGCDWGEYGNNAEPVASGQCCDDCNRNVVLKFRRENRKMKADDECNGDCSFIGGCDCKAKNAEAVRNNKILEIIGEQIIAVSEKICVVVSVDAGLEPNRIGKEATEADLELVAGVVKVAGWVATARDWCLAKGKVTIAEAIQGLDSFIFGLMRKSNLESLYYSIACRISDEDEARWKKQEIAEAELLKVIAEAKPEKKEKPKTAKQLEAEATRQANAEKKRADKAKAEFEAKSAIVQEANRKKAQDKQKAIAKAKRANQIKMAEQALANQVGKSDK